MSWRKKYLIVDSDGLTYYQQGAISRWLENTYPEMTLRAIVAMTGKSLHG